MGLQDSFPTGTCFLICWLVLGSFIRGRLHTLIWMVLPSVACISERSNIHPPQVWISCTGTTKCVLGFLPSTWDVAPAGSWSFLHFNAHFTRFWICTEYTSHELGLGSSSSVHTICLGCLATGCQYGWRYGQRSAFDSDLPSILGSSGTCLQIGPSISCLVTDHMYCWMESFEFLSGMTFNMLTFLAFLWRTRRYLKPAGRRSAPRFLPIPLTSCLQFKIYTRKPLNLIALPRLRSRKKWTIEWIE